MRENTPNQNVTQVIITQKQNAKKVKNLLEKSGGIDKSFRLSDIDSSSFSKFAPIQEPPFKIDELLLSSSRFICVPVRKEFLDEVLKKKNADSHLSECRPHANITDLIVGHATQSCPYSSSVMGNVNRRVKLESASNSSFNLVKSILVEIILELRQFSGMQESMEAMHEWVGSLSDTSAPPKLEIIGNDRTLVIPFKALNLSTDQSFQHLVEKSVGKESLKKNEFISCLWQKLASRFRSHRVVRKGEISPHSKIRESGHLILWVEPNIEMGLFARSGKN